MGIKLEDCQPESWVLPQALLSIVLALFLIMSFTADAQAAGSDESFARAMAAFKQGDYQQAVTLFEAARDEGILHPALFYNMGVAYYRIGRYAAARDSFLISSHHPPLQALSYYNLGLVSEQRDKPRKALQWFRQAYDTAPPRADELRQLAADKLMPEQGEDVVIEKKRWLVNLGMNLGYDDNVQDPRADGQTHRGDEYRDFYLVGTGVLSGGVRRGNQMDFSLYGIDFMDANDYDMRVYHLGFTRADYYEDWQLDLGIFNDLSYLAAKAYTNAPGLGVSGKKEATQYGQLYVRYRIYNIDALQGEYEYLKGIRQLLDAELRWKVGVHRARLAYGLELNDRRDKSTSNSFFSYSPTRHRLRVTFYQQLHPDWRLKSELNYRNSRYNDYNLYSDGQLLLREEVRLQARLNLRGKLSKHFNIQLDYSYTTNNSTVEAYDYDRNQYAIGLGLRF